MEPRVECRAIKGHASENKPTWHGQFRYNGGMWFFARSNYGVIAYESEALAIAGARIAARDPVRC
jgi:hypothetical protein